MHAQCGGGTKDLMTVTGMREGCSGQEDASLLSSVGRVVYSSLKLEKTHHHHPSFPQITRPSCMVTLALSNGRMSKMRKSSFSGLELLVRPP